MQNGTVLRVSYWRFLRWHSAGINGGTPFSPFRETERLRFFMRVDSSGSSAGVVAFSKARPFCCAC